MTRSILLSSVLALGSLGVASAISVSQQCQSSLLGIAGSPDAACINVQGLLPLLTTPANQSLLVPIDSWLSGACAAEPCTNDQLAALVTNVTNGCGNDLSSLGFTNDSLPGVISIFQQAYPTTRKIACLVDTTNNTFCATNLLSQIQDVYGTLSVENIISTLPLAYAGQVEGLPNSTACSDCVKEAYNILREDQPALANDESVTQSLTQQCGASFIDGSDPTQIVLGTGAAAPTAGSASANGAASFSQSALLGMTASSLAALSAAFVFLA